MGRQTGRAVQDGRVTLVRTAGPADVEAVIRLEDECLGVDAWSEGLVREGIAGALPTVVYLVAEVDEQVVGHAVVSTAGDIAELQRMAAASVALDLDAQLSIVAPARKDEPGFRPWFRRFTRSASSGFRIEEFIRDHARKPRRPAAELAPDQAQS